MNEEDKAKHDVAKSFKSGWDQKGKEGAVLPELAKAWVDNLGIHPDRVQNYADALLAYAGGKGEKPKPEEFKEAVILSLKRPQGPDKAGPA